MVVSAGLQLRESAVVRLYLHRISLNYPAYTGDGYRLLPLFQELVGFSFGKGEEQFEILAVIEGGGKRVAGLLCDFGKGNCLLVQNRADLALAAYSGEVRAETVANIHHRIDFDHPRNLYGLSDSRLEVEVLAGA